MSRKAPPPRIAWQERFERPGLDDLLDGLLRQHYHLIAAARDALLSLDGIQETILWQGVAWRWTLTYAVGPDPRPWAYIVPQPGKPSLALPIQTDLLPAFPTAKLSRPVRESIQLASRVGDACWPQWELTSKTQLRE